MERQFPAGTAVYDAYGYFHMTSAKYLLVKEAQMWKTYSFEHVFFQNVDVFTDEKLQEYRRQIREHLEPEFVRQGGKYPMADHMYTALTNVFISRKAVAAETARQIRKYKFRRYYRFALRGYCEARLAVFDLERGKVYGNRAAGQMVKSYKRLLREEEIK